MSHKPTSVRAESKASKSPVRKQVKTKTSTKRSVNQKSGFVAPKSAAKVKPAAGGKPFTLIVNGDSHGVYAAGPKGVTRLCGALQPMGQTTDPDGGKPLWQQACDALREVGLFPDAAFDARDD